jgi:TonB family protein
MVLFASSDQPSTRQPMTKYFVGLALLFAVSIRPSVAQAQKSRDNDPSASSDQTYLDFQVEQAVRPKSAPTPLYPDRLRNARIEGHVLVQFVVDDHGRPDMTTFKVLKSSDNELTESVKHAVSGMSFFPAESAGQKVKQLVQLPFTFTPGR